jgi:hypothetical protein
MAYPINAPIDFVNTNVNDVLDFQSDGPAAGVLNKVNNFVTTTAGDIVYRAAGGNNYIERLPIGSSGQILTVAGGLPSWSSAPGTTSSFTARVTASVAGIPTSRNGGANSGVWFNLDNTYVTWSTAAPGYDPSAVFTVAGGLFTAPSAGTYDFSALVSFDSGIGVTAGSGLPAAPLPSGRAIRQVQLYSPTLGGGTIIATGVEQVKGSNQNITEVAIPRVGVVLGAGDTLLIRVRHDRNAANTVTIGNPAISLPSQTYFVGQKLA